MKKGSIYGTRNYVSLREARSERLRLPRTKGDVTTTGASTRRLFYVLYRIRL